MKEHPHRSTTHEEMFFHVQEPIGPYKGATVFYRKEQDVWCGAVAFCSQDDMFNRRIGRNQSRRRFFNEGAQAVHVEDSEKPTYARAKNLALLVSASPRHQYKAH